MLKIVLTAWLIGCACAAFAQGQTQLSDAEKAIFVDAHFNEIEPPAQLRYRYEHKVAANPAAGFEDTVALQLKPTATGRCCAVHAQFLSGPRALTLPDIDEATANPITMYFLEREVRGLQQQTKGQAAHFRRRIRLALVDAAPPRPLTIRFQGRELAAREIVIAPFLNDPNRARFERWAQRRYRFILAKEVPGHVWRIEAELPGERSDVLTLLETAP